MIDNGMGVRYTLPYGIMLNKMHSSGMFNSVGKDQKKGGKKEYVFGARLEKWKQKNISF
jgi:hypothetical protein